MKNSFLIITAFAILLSGCAQSNLQNIPAEQAYESPGKTFLTYEDPDYKVRISYPSAWKLASSDDAVFAMQSPKEGTSDLFLENINLVMNDLSGEPLTLERQIDIYISQLKQSLPGFSLKESKPIVLAGEQGQKIVFTGTVGGQELKFIQAFTIKDDVAYVLTFSSQSEKFESSLETAEKMIGSFEITGSLRENLPTGEKKATIQTKSEFAGNWRVYSERIFYDIGGAGALGIPVTRVLEISDDSTWKFGDSKGKVIVSPITEADWIRWGVDNYGPKRKITLEGWNKGTADGPVEDDSGNIDFIWVVYHVEPPLVENAGTVWLKFGQ